MAIELAITDETPEAAPQTGVLPPGWIAIPAEPTADELLAAQGTWLDMGWDAPTCFLARVQALIAVSRGRYAAAVSEATGQPLCGCNFFCSPGNVNPGVCRHLRPKD